MNDRKFKYQFDPEYTGSNDGEVNNEPSQTIPDQNLSVKTLLERHTRGLPMQANYHEGEYFGIEIPRIDDLTDLEEARNRLKQAAEEFSAKVKAELQAAEERRAEAAAAAEEAKKPSGDEGTEP